LKELQAKKVLESEILGQKNKELFSEEIKLKDVKK